MMQPINLTDEQREFRAVVRQFAEDKIAPRAAETDERPSTTGRASRRSSRWSSPRCSYPEEYGGAGASLVDQAIAAEELARACASTSLMFLITKLAMLPVHQLRLGAR